MIKDQNTGESLQYAFIEFEKVSVSKENRIYSNVYGQVLLISPIRKLKHFHVPLLFSYSFCLSLFFRTLKHVTSFLKMQLKECPYKSMPYFSTRNDLVLYIDRELMLP